LIILPHHIKNSGIGKLYLEKKKKIGEIEDDLAGLAGLEKGTPIDIFEV
jgi:hypothetical protein